MMRIARIVLCRVGLLIAGLLLAGGAAQASPMQVTDSKPAAQAVMDGAATEFFVQFDGPVDHAASRLLVLQQGKIVQILQPRLQSQPNVLYSGVRRLTPGAYTLQWMTRSMPGREASRGEIPFTVQ